MGAISHRSGDGRCVDIAIERLANLGDSLVKTLAAAVGIEALPNCLELDRQAEKLAGALALLAPQRNVERVEVAIDFNRDFALEVGMPFIFFVAIGKKIRLARALLVGHGFSLGLRQIRRPGEPLGDNQQAAIAAALNC